MRGYDTPNWLTLWQTLDAQQRLKKREVLGGGTHVVELSYTYDANHNIQSIIDGVNGTHSVTGLSYDGLDRLVAATGHWGQGSFSYDSNGNIVTRQLGSASDTYHYGSAVSVTATTPRHVFADGLIYHHVSTNEVIYESYPSQPCSMA